MHNILRLFLITITIGLVMPVQGADNPNILVMGQDDDEDAVPRNNQVFDRVVGSLSNQMHDYSFDVYDETAITLDNFEQGRTRRTDAELIDIARSVKLPPIDVAVIFSIYTATIKENYTTKIKARIEGRLLNVQTGKRLGNFEVDSGKYWNAPASCDQACILAVVGDKSYVLANDLGAVLAEKLAWMVDGNSNQAQDRPATNSMVTDYNLIFDGFSAEEFSEIEEYLVVFSGYQSHRLIEASYTRTAVWYKSAIGTAKFNRNLRKMLAELNLRATINFERNSFTVRKISLRGKNGPPKADGNW